MSMSRLQRDFFGAMADPAILRTMFEHLPEVFFFVKDRQSRLIAASSHLVARLGLEREVDLIGARDEDFFPPHIARGFREDDKLVFRTGKPLKNRLEVWFDEQHNLSWFVTTKVPLRGTNGRVIGLMGITRCDDGKVARSGITQVVSRLGQRTHPLLSTAQLARESGMSERTLYRRLKQSLGVTPYQLRLRIRIQKAAEALITSQTKIIEVALSHGFCDQSAFTQHFRSRTGMTPKQFRMRHQG